MGGLCWMAVVLAFFLSAENSLAAVDQNRLATFVDGILREYQPWQGMFSLAVSIPEDQNQNPTNILQQVFQSDPGNSVKDKMDSGEVYFSNRVIAAKALSRPDGGADHAESRVVDYLGRLVNNQNDLLLFYSFASPCVKICVSDTHPASILGRINTIRQWNSYAVVFSKIFKPKIGAPITEEEQRNSLQRLATRGQIGLDNIFRCDRQNGRMQCMSCSSGNQVSRYCISDDTKSAPSQNLPSNLPKQPQQGRGGSPPQGGKGQGGGGRGRGGGGRGWGGNQGGSQTGGVGNQGGGGRGWGRNQGGSQMGGIRNQGGGGRGWGGNQGGSQMGGVGNQGGGGRGWGQGWSRGWGGNQGGGGTGGVGGQDGGGRGRGRGGGGGGRGWSRGGGGGGRGWSRGWSRGRGRGRGRG